MAKRTSFWDRVKASSETTSIIGGINNLVVFKRDGKATFVGIKDSFQNEDGDIIRGSDFRKSEEFKASKGKTRREFRRLLSEGTILSDEEATALVDEQGGLRPEAIRGDEDININLEKLKELATMREQKEAFEKAQSEAEFARDEKEEEEAKSPADSPRVISEGGFVDEDSSESGGNIKSSTLSKIDEKTQDWINAFQASITPEGTSVGSGN